MTVSVEDMKAHLNVTGDEDDALIASITAAAETYIDGFLDRKLEDYEADDEDVPAPILQAIKMLGAHLYECRETTLVGVSAQPVPIGAFDLIAAYRSWSFG